MVPMAEVVGHQVSTEVEDFAKADYPGEGDDESEKENMDLNRQTCSSQGCDLTVLMGSNHASLKSET